MKYQSILTKEFLEREYIINKKSMNKIAKGVGCSITTVLNQLHRHRISSRKNTFYKKYKLNENYFKNINTAEKAYWLGFLTADAGMIYNKHRLQLDLAIKDKSHVLKFRKVLDSTHKLFHSLHNKKYESAMLSITNLKLFTDLSRIFDRKLMPLINDKLIRHFIRGVFDGDGCIMYLKNRKETRVSILGLKSFLEDLKTTLPFICNKKIHEVGGIYELRLLGSYVFKFMDWIYKNTTDRIRLTRKFDKYCQILKQKQEDKHLCQI